MGTLYGESWCFRYTDRILMEFKSLAVNLLLSQRSSPIFNFISLTSQKLSSSINSKALSFGQYIPSFTLLLAAKNWTVATIMFVQKGGMLLPKGVTIAERTMTRSLSAMALSSPLSPSPHTATTQTQQRPKQQFGRTYVSRAHPRPVPEFSVPTGLQMVLDGVEERKKQRVARWERNKDKRRSKGIEVSLIFICWDHNLQSKFLQYWDWTIIQFRIWINLKLLGEERK